MNDVTITIAGLPNTGKGIIAGIIKEALLNNDLKNVTIAEDDADYLPYQEYKAMLDNPDFDKQRLASIKVNLKITHTQMELSSNKVLVDETHDMLDK